MQLDKIFSNNNIFFGRVFRSEMRAWLLFIVLLVISHGAHAVVNCKASTLYPPMSVTPNITISSSTAGDDLPVGKTIYRIGIGYSRMLGINCDAAFDVPVTARITTTPTGSPITMTTDRGDGSVYPTNVSGVGVAIYTSYPVSGSSALLGASSVQIKNDLVRTSSGDAGIGVYTGGTNLLSIMLVKTGPIASGSVVNASSFPHFVVEAHAWDGYSGLPISLFSGRFTGSSQFITQTCTTPSNMTVNLGKYEISGNFKAIGTTTKWVDSSIVLQNCPNFFGYYGHGGTNAPVTEDTSSISGGTRIANIFSISILPVNKVTGNVIGLDSDVDEAQGVGVQLGYSPNNLTASPTEPTTLWTLGQTWDLQAPVVPSGGTIKIPLAARYYQTEDTLSPGKANTKLVVGIDYK